jgi:DNA-binding transcriptional LysR family regulator
VIDPSLLGWDDVHAFLALSRAGNVPGAARVLGVSEATVGRRLQRLESVLGARLFDRLPNRLSPTPLGQELARVGATMEAGAAALAQRASTWNAAGDAPVRVTATGSVSLFLAGNARQLSGMAAAQGCILSLMTTRAPLDLAAGEADIALRMRRLPDRGPLTARKLGRMAFSVYAARSLPGRNAPPDDWQGLTLIGLPETHRVPSQSRWLDDAAGARRGVIALRLGDVALRHRAVQNGAGASLLPCFLGDADPELRRLLDPPGDLIEDIYLMLDDHGRRRPQVCAVAELLRSMFRNAADSLGGNAVGHGD